MNTTFYICRLYIYEGGDVSLYVSTIINHICIY
nr:MAG TPA: hypothetical protein [Bacteriophage sp.]